MGHPQVGAYVAVGHAVQRGRADCAGPHRVLRAVRLVGMLGVAGVVGVVVMVVEQLVRTRQEVVQHLPHQGPVQLRGMEGQVQAPR